MERKGTRGIRYNVIAGKDRQKNNSRYWKKYNFKYVFITKPPFSLVYHNKIKTDENSSVIQQYLFLQQYSLKSHDWVHKLKHIDQGFLNYF